MKAWKLLRQSVLQLFKNLPDTMKISGFLYGLIAILRRGYEVYFGISCDQALSAGPEQGQSINGWIWPSAVRLSTLSVVTVSRTRPLHKGLALAFCGDFIDFIYCDNALD